MSVALLKLPHVVRIVRGGEGGMRVPGLSANGSLSCSPQVADFGAPLRVTRVVNSKPENEYTQVVVVRLLYVR